MGVADEKKGIDQTLKDLKLTNEEVDKFAKAFKDPEFIKLFEDYAKEVSDPKVKAETDMYLRQLEMEGRVEEVYGKGSQLILPEPSYVIKTSNTLDNIKCFINICVCEKVEKASLKSSVNENGQKGSHFDMPLCLGPKKSGADKSGKPCSVWDFVVNPETLKMANTTPAVKQTMIETAMEHIEKQHSDVKLSRDFKLPKLIYKGTEACPTPHALAMRGEGGVSVNGRVKPTGGQESRAPVSPQNAEASNSAVNGAKRSNFSFDKQKSKPSVEPNNALSPAQEGFVHPSGEITPKWEIIHRGQIDLAEAWGDAGRGMSINVTHPKELVLRIILPGVTTVASVQLDVSRNDVSVSVPGKYRLQTPLPYPVNSDLGKAKFDKAKQQLEVTLPVIPPPLPAPPLLSTQVDEIEVLEPSAVDDVKNARPLEETAVPQLDPTMGQGYAERPESLDVVRQEAHANRIVDPAAASVSQRTENQRKWEELHVESPVTQDQLGEKVLTPSSDSDIQGAVPAQVQHPFPSVKLQPRLKSTIADELD